MVSCRPKLRQRDRRPARAAAASEKSGSAKDVDVPGDHAELFAAGGTELVHAFLELLESFLAQHGEDQGRGLGKGAGTESWAATSHSGGVCHLGVALHAGVVEKDLELLLFRLIPMIMSIFMGLLGSSRATQDEDHGAPVGKGRLQKVQADEGGEEIETGMNPMAEGHGEQDEQPGDGT